MDTCVFSNPQDFLWNTCGIDQPLLAVLHYQEFPIGSRSCLENPTPNSLIYNEAMRLLLTTCTISRQPAGWFGALESLGPWDSAPQTMIPCVWQYGNMVILTNAQFGKMSPQGPSTQSQRVQKNLLRIPLFFLLGQAMFSGAPNGKFTWEWRGARDPCITHTKPIKRSNQSQTAKFARTCLDYKYHAKQLNQQNDQRTSQHHFNGLRWPVVDTQ